MCSFDCRHDTVHANQQRLLQMTMPFDITQQAQGSELKALWVRSLLTVELKLVNTSAASSMNMDTCREDDNSTPYLQ